MPATLITASSPPNSSTSPVKSASIAAASVTDAFDARAAPPAATMRSAVVSGRGLVLRETVDRHPRVDGDDVRAGAPDRFGDGGADPGPTPGHDDDLLPIRCVAVCCQDLPFRRGHDAVAQGAASEPCSIRRPAKSPRARQSRSNFWYAKKSPKPPR